MTAPLVSVAMRIAEQQSFTCCQGYALMALAEMSWHGKVRASLPTIARKARQSEREVFRSVHFLASQGLVEIVSRTGQPTEYIVCFGSYSRAAPLPESQGSEPEPLPGSQGSEEPPLPNGHDHPCQGVKTTLATESGRLYPLRLPLVRKKKEPPQAPPQAGGCVVPNGKDINPSLEQRVLAWATARGLSAGDVTEMAALIRDKLANGKLRRCVDPEAELRDRLRGLQTFREVRQPGRATLERMRRDREARGGRSFLFDVEAEGNA